MICDQCETVAHCTKNGCIPMFNKPAHKNVDNPPGQIVNPVPQEQQNVMNQDRPLSEAIKRYIKEIIDQYNSENSR